MNTSANHFHAFRSRVSTFLVVLQHLPTKLVIAQRCPWAVPKATKPLPEDTPNIWEKKNKCQMLESGSLYSTIRHKHESVNWIAAKTRGHQNTRGQRWESLRNPFFSPLDPTLRQGVGGAPIQVGLKIFFQRHRGEEFFYSNPPEQRFLKTPVLGQSFLEHCGGGLEASSVSLCSGENTGASNSTEALERPGPTISCTVLPADQGHASRCSPHGGLPGLQLMAPTLGEGVGEGHRARKHSESKSHANFRTGAHRRGAVLPRMNLFFLLELSDLQLTTCTRACVSVCGGEGKRGPDEKRWMRQSEHPQERKGDLVTRINLLIYTVALYKNKKVLIRLTI